MLAVWITGWVAKMIGSALGLSLDCLDCKIYMELCKQSLSQKGEKYRLLVWIVKFIWSCANKVFVLWQNEERGE